jgi:hypothetical protein
LERLDELKVMSSVYSTSPPNFSTVSRSVLMRPVTSASSSAYSEPLR